MYHSALGFSLYRDKYYKTAGMYYNIDTQKTADFSAAESNNTWQNFDIKSKIFNSYWV